MPPKKDPKRSAALHRNRGSGFEDGFADPPITPSEYLLERDIYRPSLPFYSRIKDCIERYLSRRRLTCEQHELFMKYLALGGMENPQNPPSVAAVTKGKWFDPDIPGHWDVDFSGVVAGFLGCHLPEQYGYNGEEVQVAAELIVNFLKYVSHHDVCPEYAEDLKKAIQICGLALAELPSVAYANNCMPGDFNVACRVLFCSTGKPTCSNEGTDIGRVGIVLYEDKQVKDSVGHKALYLDTAFLVRADFDAEHVFKTTMRIWEPELMDRVDSMALEPLRVVHTFTNSFEVIDIVLPDATIAEQYRRAESKRSEQSKVRPAGPVGYLVLKPATLQDGWDRRAAPATSEDIISVYMDQVVLQYPQRGMKMRLTICELDFGMKFIKGAGEVFPTFYEFLPQSLMLQWKTPRPHKRPPPSAADPEVAEELEEKEREKDEQEVLQEQRKQDGELNRELLELEEVRRMEKSMEKLRV
ncbi:Argonaute complex, subunit Arb1 [Coniella lustricola]|uniref:Argonaute complex, subunit Arb1 n=1 Tax=Coniella lustricola TaxID=2025994 RepID=A0A2T3ANG2_9PEZI|nr:Argonaute complex, subunit Arb1 [Coniella lustricola]